MNHDFLSVTGNRCMATSYYGMFGVKCSEINNGGAEYVNAYIGILDEEDDPDWSPANDRVANNVVRFRGV